MLQGPSASKMTEVLETLAQALRTRAADDLGIAVEVTGIQFATDDGLSEGYFAAFVGDDAQAELGLSRAVAVVVAGLVAKVEPDAIAARLSENGVSSEEAQALEQVLPGWIVACGAAVDALQGLSWQAGTTDAMSRVSMEDATIVSMQLRAGTFEPARVTLRLPASAFDTETSSQGTGVDLSPEELAALREVTRRVADGKPYILVPLPREKKRWEALLAEAEFEYVLVESLFALTKAAQEGEVSVAVIDADACPAGGLPALVALKDASGGTVPSIIVASSPTRRHLLSCVAAGASTYLPKPLAAAALAASMQHLGATG